MAFDLGAVVAHIQADISQFTTGINQAKEQVGEFSDNVGSTLEGLKSFAQQAATFVGIEAAAFGIAGKGALEAASNYEQTRIALDSMTGSAEQGGKAMKMLDDFAKEAPVIPVQQIMEAGKQLLAFGTPLDQLQTKLREVGEASVAMNKPMIQMIDVFNFAKEGVFNSRMFASLGMGKESLAQFGAEFDKAGKLVDKSTLLPAMEKLINAKFGTIFDKEKDTWKGAVQNIVDDGNRLGAAFMGVDSQTGHIRDGSLFRKLEDAANALFKFLDAHMDLIKSLTQSKTLQTVVEGFVIALASLIIIIPVVLAVLNPVVLVVIAIQAAIVLLYAAWQGNWGGIRETTQSVMKEISNLFNNYLLPLLKMVQEWWSAHSKFIIKELTGAWEIITGVIRLALGTIYNIIKIWIDVLTGNWGQLWVDINNLVQNGWQSIKKILNGALDFIDGWAGMLLSKLTQPFKDAWKQIDETVNKIKDKLDFTQRHSPSVIDIIENGVSLANKALSGLAFNNTFSVNPQTAFQGVGGGSIYNPEIHVHLDGAIIADSSSASSIGEKIGDGIIKKLQLNIRV